MKHQSAVWNQCHVTASVVTKPVQTEDLEATQLCLLLDNVLNQLKAVQDQITHLEDNSLISNYSSRQFKDK